MQITLDTIALKKMVERPYLTLIAIAALRPISATRVLVLQLQTAIAQIRQAIIVYRMVFLSQTVIARAVSPQQQVACALDSIIMLAAMLEDIIIQLVSITATQQQLITTIVLA